MSKRVLFEETPFGWAAARHDDDRAEVLLHRFKHRSAVQFGDVLEGRAGHHDKRLGAQIITLQDGEGLLPVRDRVYPQGQALLVGVRREAIGDKRPVLTDRPVLSFPAASWLVERRELRPGPLGKNDLPPSLLAGLSDDPVKVSQTTAAVRLLAHVVDHDTDEIFVSQGALAAAFKPFLPPGLSVTLNPSVGSAIEELEDEALSARVALAGGGSLTIDETEALTAIDVDMGKAGGQSGRGAAESLKDKILDHLAAAVAVRSLGGQIVLDLPRRSVRTPKILRDQLNAAMKGVGLSSIPAITKEGLVVLVLGQNRQSLLERLTVLTEAEAIRPGRVLAPDVTAWRAYRHLDRALSASPSARFTLTLPKQGCDLWERVFGERDLLPCPAWKDRVTVKTGSSWGDFMAEQTA